MPYNKNNNEIPKAFEQSQSHSSLLSNKTVHVDGLSQKPSERSHKLWYFYFKKDLVTNVDVTKLDLFHQENPLNDRVVNQLLYVPPDYENYAKDLPIDRYKKIHLDDGPNAFWKVKYGECE